jgi:hypothetical protein
MRVLAQFSNTEAGLHFLGRQSPRSVEQFTDRVPITRYSDWEPWILQQKAERRVSRYEPTSGSTHARKWIPYTPELLREFDAAAAPWISDLHRRFSVSHGRHYWSLSWIPSNLRAEMEDTSDVLVLPFWKRIFLERVLVGSPQIARLPTLAQSKHATLTLLTHARDLTLLSAWSPTFVLGLLDDLSAEREAIAHTLQTGRWSIPEMRAPRCPRTAGLLRDWDGKLSPEFLATLWPELKLISCWDSSTSAPWARRLATYFPRTHVQGKGLWATEGVVTIPYLDHYPLAITSHFLEFRCLHSGQIKRAWELELGQRVQPLLTTGSGFFRLELDDELEVTDFLEQTPCLRFIGRLGGVDLVGEKLDTQSVRVLLEEISRTEQIQCVSLLAREGGANRKARYLLLAEGRSEREAQLAKIVEDHLLQLHHYRLARELGQLEPAGAVLRPDAIAFYHALPTQVGVAGARKIEPLTLWKESSR